MSDSDTDFEQAQAYREVVEKLWTEPVFDACDEALPTTPGATVLIAEARCGMVAIELAERLGEQCRVMALDSHGPMLDLARKRAEGAAGEERIYFVNQRVNNLSYADGVFEAGICLDGLYTGRQAMEGVAELVRVTADDGTVVVAAPLSSSFAEYYDLLDEAFRAHKLDDVVPRIDSLRQTLISPGQLAGAARNTDLDDFSIEKLSWELSFEDGHDFLHSPLIRQSVFPHWIGMVRSSDREPVLRYVSDAIDTYWHGGPFTTVIEAGLLVGEK